MKRIARASDVLLCATLALAATPSHAAVIEGAAGPSLLMGPDGLGLVAYYDRTNGDLKVAHCVDAACTTVTAVTVDSAGDVGRKTSMVMGSAGLVIAYEDTTNSALKLALCTDPLCTGASSVTVDGGLAGKNTAVALAADGRPLLAYIASPLSPRLKAAHCEDANCLARTISDLSEAGSDSLGLVVAGDGRGMIHFTRAMSGFPIPGSLLHCADLACTAGSGVSGLPSRASRVPQLGPFISHPSMRVGADGFVRVAVAYSYFEGSSVKLLRCTNAECVGGNVATIPAQAVPPSLALGTDGLPLLVMTAAQPTAELRMVHCLDADCTTQAPHACLAGMGARPSLQLDSGGTPLVAFERGDNVEVMQPPAACIPVMAVSDSGLVERTPPTPPGQMTFQIGIAPPSPATVQVSYQTVDGTAQAGLDYVPASGTLTFAPDQLQQSVEVTVVPDSLPEPDETLELVLSAPVGITIVDPRGVGVIHDDDEPPLPELSAGDCSAPEGDTGTTGCAFEVALTPPSAQTVSVSYQTVDGSAAAGSDFLASAGTLTFAPGTVTRTVSVSIVGDTAVELDETFFVNLSNPVNATILDGVGDGTILDDDAPSLSSLELTHGARVAADLAAAPGPLVDQDVYRLAQGPYSSWEIVVDDVSGDIAPGLRLERLAEDNSTVLQAGVSVGTGSARALRWQRRFALSETRQHIRVQSTSCTTDCGPDDTYRLRAYETTGRVPRFNNSGSQITVLILQNATDQPVQAHADFWDTTGSLRATVPVPLGPRAMGLVNTSAVGALTGISGSVTVSHDGPYGGLVGKAVALEPSTGFSFDSPMVTKPR